MAKQNSFLGGDYFLWLLQGGGGDPPNGPPTDVWTPADYTATLGCITTFDFQSTKLIAELGTRCGDLETYYDADVTINVETLAFNRNSDASETLIRQLEESMGWAINSPFPNPALAGSIVPQLNNVYWWLAWDQVANHVRYAGVGTISDFNLGFPQDELSPVSLTLSNRATNHPVWTRDEDFVGP